MADESPIPQAETCGSCKFGRRVDLQAVECRGLPPTPVVVATQPNLAGQPQAAIQLLYAVIPHITPACALYVNRPMLDLLTKTEGNG